MSKLKKQIFKNLGNRYLETFDTTLLHKGADNKPVNITDILAIKEELLLASKLTGKERTAKVFANLLSDLRSGAFMGRWNLRQEDFQSLAVLLKPHFNNASRETLRLLLIQTRAALNNLKNSGGRYYRMRRARFSRLKDPGQTVTCRVEARLTPLSSDFYRAFLMPLAAMRIGAVVLKSVSYANTAKQFYNSDRRISPVIGRNRIHFTIKDTDVSRESWREVVELRAINTGSKLNILRRNEDALAKRGCLTETRKGLGLNDFIE